MTWRESNMDRSTLKALKRISQSLEARRRRNREFRSVQGEVRGQGHNSAGVRRVSGLIDAKVQRW